MVSVEVVVGEMHVEEFGLVDGGEHPVEFTWFVHNLVGNFELCGR